MIHTMKIEIAFTFIDMMLENKIFNKKILTLIDYNNYFL